MSIGTEKFTMAYMWTKTFLVEGVAIVYVGDRIKYLWIQVKVHVNVGSIQG